MMLLSDSHVFTVYIASNMPTDCHLMGGKNLPLQMKAGTVILNTTISPSDNMPRQSDAPEKTRLFFFFFGCYQVTYPQ